MFKKLPIPFIYIWVTGLALGLLFSFKSFIPFLYWDELDQFQWYRSLLPHFINYMFWPVLVPIVYWVFREFKIAHGASLRDRTVNIAASIVIPLFHEIVTTIIYFVVLETFELYDFNDETWHLIKGAIPGVIIVRMLEYWVIYGLFAAFDYYRKYKNKQAEIVRIEAQLNKSKLAVLKMQLQPHFLFNALNSISSLMDIDVAKAQTMVARLGDLLRGVLEQDDRTFISVNEELAYVNTYLEIEKVRFNDRLTVSISVDKAIDHEPIPMLIIQPLVENAIKHGAAGSPGQCHISIEARALGPAKIEIKVSDNGSGSKLMTNELFDSGVGLNNIRARLKELYAGDHSMDIKTEPGRGFEICLIIPKT